MRYMMLALKMSFVTAMLFDPELCDDCGAPLFPDRSGDVVHAELPDDGSLRNSLYFTRLKFIYLKKDRR